jgi:hypothetical protein
MLKRSHFRCPAIGSSLCWRPVRTNLVARVVVDLGDATLTRPVADAFRRNGWEVHVASCPDDARQMIREIRPLASVLAATPPHRESGWLTCKKLILERPNLKVVLVEANPTARDHRLAEFVGAVACVPMASPCAAVKAATGFELPSAN